jgi:hypothetical protein
MERRSRRRRSAGDAVWDALVGAGVTPEPYAEPTPPPDALVPLSVVAERLKAAGVWEAIVALVFDPANRAALADLIMVQQGIAPSDSVARALISAAGETRTWCCGPPESVFSSRTRPPQPAPGRAFVIPGFA